MLAIAVDFLTRRYVATAHHHRNQPEWPPHPARLFSALVATRADAEEQDERERTVLEWLETLPPPRIQASDADERAVLTHYVPTNDVSVLDLSLQERRYRRLEEHLAAVDQALDEAGGDETSRKVRRARTRIEKERDVAAQVESIGKTPVETATALLPEGRGKQPRTYPSVTPHDPVVVYCWPDVELDAERREALDGLLARVVRLGHSSSFVSCRLVDGTGEEPRYAPGPGGQEELRGVGPGQLEALEQAYTRHQGSGARSLPYRAVRYHDRKTRTAPLPSEPSSVLSGELIVFERTGGARLPLTRTVDLARALRGAILRHVREPIPEEISGHRTVDPSDPARPTERAHVAFLALPFVAAAHATGHVLGVGMLLPRYLDYETRAPALQAIGRWEHERQHRLPLLLGSGVTMVVERIVGRPDRVSLDRWTWARSSRSWATVTPIALDRHPGDLWGRSESRVEAAFDRARDTVCESCVNVGLPMPAHVSVTLQPPIAGTRPTRAFPRFHQGHGRRRVQRALVHTRLTFPEPVKGPILLGAGRYLGLGLLRPLDDHRQGRD